MYYPRGLHIPSGWKLKKCSTPIQKGKKRFIHPETLKTYFCLPENAPPECILWLDYKKLNSKQRPKLVLWVTDGTKNKKIASVEDLEDGWRLGKTVKKSMKPRKQRVGNGSTKDRTAYTDGTHIRFLKDGDEIPEGFQLGATKRNMSPMSNFFWVTNGKDNKVIEKGNEIPEGYAKGRFRSW